MNIEFKITEVIGETEFTLVVENIDARMYARCRNSWQVICSRKHVIVNCDIILKFLILV